MTSVMAVLVAIGTLIGFLSGRGYQVAVRARSDYKKVKGSLPDLQKAFWAAVRAAILVVMVAVVWMVGSVWIAAAGADDNKAPPSAPTPAPTRTR
jgi:hypothetical protein